MKPLFSFQIMRENCTECTYVIDELATLQNSFERIVDGLPKGM